MPATLITELAFFGVLILKFLFRVGGFFRKRINGVYKSEECTGRYTGHKKVYTASRVDGGIPH